MRFYAVPDDFDVWDAPTTSDPRVEVASVPAGGEPADRRNVSINVNFNNNYYFNFNTKKVLMYKFSSTFAFVVSDPAVSDQISNACYILDGSIIISVPTPLYITTSQQTLPTTTTSTSNIIELTIPPMATAEGEHFHDNNGHGEDNECF